MLLSPDPLSTHDLKRITDAVYAHCGINLHEGKQELVQARLAKLLRHSPFESLTDYLDQALADKDGSDFSALIDSLSTNLTSFFRESEHFTYLGHEFLPQLLTRKRTRNHSQIRGWSAACSTGEEPYSIALILRDFLDTLARGMTARVLATDISNRVLRLARESIYDRERTAPVPPPLKRYLIPSAKRVHAVEPVPAVREMVRFAHLNLMESWPFTGPFDFIFCRNVMIYFDKPTQQRLIARFYDILEPGGLLFTGHSESLTGITHRFRYVQPTIYLKT